jgi:2-iminobutanoate/2-iminopropanoate deaminase
MPRTAVNVPSLAPPAGPFSPAVRTGNLLYVSGQVAHGPATGRLVAGDVTRQTERVFENLQAVVSAADKSFAGVVLPLCAAVEIDLVAE